MQPEPHLVAKNSAMRADKHTFTRMKRTKIELINAEAAVWLQAVEKSEQTFCARSDWPAFLNGVPEQRRHIRAAKAFDLAHSGR